MRCFQVLRVRGVHRKWRAAVRSNMRWSKSVRANDTRLRRTNQMNRSCSSDENPNGIFTTGMHWHGLIWSPNPCCVPYIRQYTLYYMPPGSGLQKTCRKTYRSSVDRRWWARWSACYCSWKSSRRPWPPRTPRSSVSRAIITGADTRRTFYWTAPARLVRVARTRSRNGSGTTLSWTMAYPPTVFCTSTWKTTISKICSRYPRCRLWKGYRSATITYPPSKIKRYRTCGLSKS